ncbi:MAG: ATP-binding protein [Gammaproteobacteria bacterium]|nr:ATP-binding protein [Gammaproteobacteria bacterium]
MNQQFASGHRLLLFRSYLYLAAGLLIVAVVLDFGFGRLQSSEDPEHERWLVSTFSLIERELGAVPESERAALASALGDDIGLGVQLLQRDDVVDHSGSQDNIATLISEYGETSFLRDAESIDAIIRIGPVAEHNESIFLQLLPPVFYLSIFVVVGIWLRPLLRDISLITSGAQRFAADYREPLDTADKTTELTGLARNLDDMSSRLSGLIQSQKELIAALSHEMRTPLARIRFALAVMGNKDDRELQERLDALNDDVQEIDQLIASMLNYARLDHPDLRMHWQQVPVDAWLEQLQEKCQQPGKNIEIAGSDSVESAWMDPRLMGLAVSNLLVNACRYADSQVRCGIRQQDSEYVITVEDDGKGIPEEERDAIFKAFTRIDDSRNRDTGGYGLGLAIVSRIAELHGGTVRVEAAADLGGALFSLRWAPPPQD